MDYPENSLPCVPLNTFTILWEQHIALLKAWMLFKATDKMRFVGSWALLSEGEAPPSYWGGVVVGSVVHIQHLMAVSRWNTGLKKKLLVRGVTTLTCLPFVSREDLVGGYVSLIQEKGRWWRCRPSTGSPLCTEGWPPLQRNVVRNPPGVGGTQVPCLLLCVVFDVTVVPAQHVRV